MPSTSSADEAGVVERELDGLDRGVRDRPADVLGERQVADADDRHAILDAAEEIAVDVVESARGARDTADAADKPRQRQRSRQRPSHGLSGHGLARPGRKRPLEHRTEPGYTAAMPCPACDRLERARAGRDPDFVAALPEASVFLADERVTAATAWLSPTSTWSSSIRCRYRAPGAAVEERRPRASALRKEVRAGAAQLACLGNFLTHVHGHLSRATPTTPSHSTPIRVRPLARATASSSGGRTRCADARLRRALA